MHTSHVGLIPHFQLTTLVHVTLIQQVWINCLSYRLLPPAEKLGVFPDTMNDCESSEGITLWPKCDNDI